MNRTELYEKYAQQVVEGMDIDDLMNVVKYNIIEALEDLPEPDALSQIEEHEPDLLIEYKEQGE